MGTPHNEAKKGDFAKTVLMPGDPLRSKFIAETFLTDLKLVNNVRGVQGYTGLYKGVPVSVMASGMGMPSIGIYSYELYTQYDVENIIRVGSAGALRADLELGSVVAGQGACANSAYLEQYELGGTFAPIADFDLLMAAVESAKELGGEDACGQPLFLRHLLRCRRTEHALPKDGRHGGGDGGCGPVLQRCLHRQAGAGHLLHLRQSGDGGGAVPGGPADHVHQHDEDCAGSRREDGGLRPIDC